MAVEEAVRFKAELTEKAAVITTSKANEKANKTADTLAEMQKEERTAKDVIKKTKSEAALTTQQFAEEARQAKFVADAEASA